MALNVSGQFFGDLQYVM